MTDLIERAKAALEGVTRQVFEFATEDQSRRAGAAMDVLPELVAEVERLLASNARRGRQILGDGDEKCRLRNELTRARRGVQMLTRQLDALHDSDLGALATRNDELAAENADLKAKLAALGVTV